MILIPHHQLDPHTLASLIEEFVTRDGAIHGHADTSTQQRIASVLDQLKMGTVVIAFDEQTESATLIAAHQLPKTNGPA